MTGTESVLSFSSFQHIYCSIYLSWSIWSILWYPWCPKWIFFFNLSIRKTRRMWCPVRKCAWTTYPGPSSRAVCKWPGSSWGTEWRGWKWERWRTRAARIVCRGEAYRTRHVPDVFENDCWLNKCSVFVSMNSVSTGRDDKELPACEESLSDEYVAMWISVVYNSHFSYNDTDVFIIL